MIRNIVFDMGQVLVRFDPNRFLDREGIMDAGDRKIVMNELFRSMEWAQMDLGTMTEEMAEAMIMPRIPERLREKAGHLLWHWADDREMIDGMEELAAGLKVNGYRLFLLSNASVAQHTYWPRFPVSRQFDGKLISCDVRVVKPMPEIYRIFMEKFSLKPEECLFIDDAAINVAAAVAQGWQGIVFHGDAEELKRKLRLAGIRTEGIASNASK